MISGDTGHSGQPRGRDGRERGFVMLVAMLLMTGLIWVAGTSAIRSTRQTQVTAVQLDNVRTFYAAEGAVEWGSGELKNLLGSNMDPNQAELDALPVPTISGYSVDQFAVTKIGSLTEEIISSGDYTGLRGYVQRYSVQSRVSSDRRSAAIIREIQHQFIPLFQFGVFYEKDLEIYPGVLMTFTGPIHTNGSLYMGSEAGLQCQSTVTVVGKYWHFRKDNAHVDPPGYVRIKDQFGNWQDVWRGSYWLDNRQPTWAADALALWNGRFRDKSHGLSTLKLPLPPATDQHVIVERQSAGDTQLEIESKYWYKAGVRYVNGALTDSAGSPLVQPGVYTYSPNKFYDDRENKWMDVVEINISAMMSGGYVPANRIIYVSYDGTDAAVRIINGGTLPVGGLTIATDLPMYIKGHYNNVAKKGSALLCDAITLLSPNWNDSKSSWSLNDRIPTAMTVNACVMTGHVPTDSSSTYSGGLENLFRFLEKWTSSISVTYRGSIIDLWNSQHATNDWSYGGFYTAPQRNWGYDTDLQSPANWPPGTPKVQTVQRGTWRQIS